MDYRVVEVALDAQLERDVLALAAAGFGTAFEEGRLARTMTSPGRGRPLCMAAKIGDELIGFNGFMSHRLTLGGGKIDAYQSCWTVTSPAHRGKKIFQNLIYGAREILKAREAGFIFGYPNEVSRPLFVGKLNFREIATQSWSVPNLMPGWERGLTSPAGKNGDGGIGQDDEELITLKRKTCGDKVKVVENGPDLLWGIMKRQSRRRLFIPYFSIGGIRARDGAGVKALIARARRKIGFAVTMHMLTSETNTYNRFFASLRPEATAPLIIDDLMIDTNGMAFDFFGGIRDYW